MNRRAFVAAAATWPLAALAAPKRRRLPPVDQGTSNPGFRRFRDELLAAVARRDAAYLASILAADVRASFGGDAGLADFLATWRPGAADSPVWRALDDALRMGGSFEPDGSFSAPYVYSRFPDDLEAMEHVVAIARDARLLAAPADDAATIARLDHDILKLAQDGLGEGEAWIKVYAPSGRVGFVRAADVRSPLGVRAGFARRDGRWKLIYLVGGD